MILSYYISIIPYGVRAGCALMVPPLAPLPFRLFVHSASTALHGHISNVGAS